MIDTIRWKEDCVELIDQTRLPAELVYRECRNVEVLAEAIESLRVRGAPAIGIAAAFGVALGAHEIRESERQAFLR
jgi:methylthioribose-1-phosphate isomerase